MDENPYKSPQSQKLADTSGHPAPARSRWRNAFALCVFALVAYRFGATYFETRDTFELWVVIVCVICNLSITLALIAPRLEPRIDLFTRILCVLTIVVGLVIQLYD
jgi:hypothetical protein